MIQASSSYIVGDQTAMILATGGDGCTGNTWNAFGGRKRKTMMGHGFPILCVAATTDFEFIVTGSEDTSAMVWEANTGELFCDLTKNGHTGAVTAVAISGEHGLVLTGSADGTARVWDIHGDGSCTQIMDHITDHNDDQKVKSERGLGRYNSAEKSPKRCSRELKEGSSRGGGSPRGSSRKKPGPKTLKGGGNAGSGRRHTLKAAAGGGAARVNAVAFSESATWVVTGSDDGTARLWKVDPNVTDSTRMYHHALQGSLKGGSLREKSHYNDGSGVAAVATASWGHDHENANAKGMVVATGSTSGTTKLWDAITGDCLYVDCSTTRPRGIRSSIP